MILFLPTAGERVKLSAGYKMNISNDTYKRFNTMANIVYRL